MLAFLIVQKKKNISNNNNGELGGQANDKGGTAKKEEAVPAEIAEVDAKGRDEVKNDETSPSETDKAERHESSDPSATLEDKSPSDSAPDQTATAEPAVSATPTGSAEAAAASRPREGGTNITQTASFDSDKNVMSMSDDTASTRSESSKPEENDSNGETKANNDFSVSRVHGVGTVVVAPSATEGPSQSGGPNGNDKGEARNRGDSSAGDDANNDDWETVEVKGRSNRKKGGRASGQSNNGHSQNGGNKSKSTRTSASRKRVANRKMAKDILSSVLDSVDEEVKRKQQLKARSAKTSTPQKPAWQVPRTIGQVNGANKEPPSGTLRDVVVGNQAGNQQRKGTQGSQKNSTTKQPGNASSKTVEKGDSSSLGKRVKGQTAVGADQNTASTVPETVSAVSDARRMQASSDRDITRSDWSSGGDSDEARKQDHPSKKANSAKDASPAPPLPTLLSPGNANSSSSSVASSLEAPHANHGHHHTPANENDVGYHLLDVCNRLTRDMDVFMGRRAAALGTRRKERGALLAALQECVSVSYIISLSFKVYCEPFFSHGFRALLGVRYVTFDSRFGMGIHM